MYKINYINHKNNFPCKPDCFLCACYMNNIIEYELDELAIKLKKIMLHSLKDYFIVNNLLDHYFQMELCLFEIRNQMYELKHIEFYEDNNTIYI